MKKVFLILMVLALVACFDPPVDTSQIQRATEAQVEAVSLGLNKGFSISNAYTQKLRADEYAFCARLRGPGIDDVEVWFIREQDGLPGTIYSISSGSHPFSEWPRHREFVPYEVESNIKRHVKGR